jgi:RNA polymerase sigma-70 factor (ECF subfamily)
MSDVERAFRQAQGKAVATLVRVFGDISLAEDAVQDAFVKALDSWPRDGIPSNSVGWIIATARNRAIDIVRRDARGRALTTQIAAETRSENTATEGENLPLMRDDQLRLIFTCCHPALRLEHQVALTLRLIAGLTPAEVARAFLISEATLAKRLVRAKYKIKAAHIAYRVPDDAELPERLRVVLTVLYLIYNAGADDPQNRADLRGESIRLTRALVALMPDEPEAAGLLALILLCEARAPARWADGDLVLLREQDRSLWDQALISEGQALVLAGLRRRRVGPFQLQAAIHGVHSAAKRFEDTDWAAILRFYDRLVILMPTPVVVLNRAVALAETQGPAAALGLLDSVADELDDYHLLHASRASMLERMGCRDDAERAYARAADLAPTNAETRFLTGRREDLAWGSAEDLREGGST